MKVKINTTSNYRNLNGKILEVKEIVGNRVSCKFTDEFGGDLTIDFGKSEVEIVDEDETPINTPTKIYIVKSYFGTYEDSYETIDGTFFTEQEAKDLLDKINKDIQKLKELDQTIDWNLSCENYDDNYDNYQRYEHLYDFLRSDCSCYNFSKIETLTIGETCANYWETYSTAKEVVEEEND